MPTEFFKFARFEELNAKDVFKWNDKGVFYTLIQKSDTTALIQTKYGKLRNYQITKDKFQKEVMLYPERKNNF
jgi:hypothetical protein